LSIKFTSKSHKAGDENGLPVVIREATEDDRLALRQLAERDSTRVPAEPLIVAMVGDEIRAAASLGEGSVIADPFHPTAEVAALAELRAAQLRAARRQPLRLVARTPAAEAARPLCDPAC